MAKYRLKTSASVVLGPKRPNRTKLVRAGDEVELTDEQAEGFRKAGVLVEDDDEEGVPAGSGDPDVPPPGQTDLPVRPSNGGTKVEWRTYLEQLKAVTDPEMDEPLEIPADANRDQMIAIGDARVAEWNEGA